MTKKPNNEFFKIWSVFEAVLKGSAFLFLGLLSSCSLLSIDQRPSLDGFQKLPREQADNCFSAVAENQDRPEIERGRVLYRALFRKTLGKERASVAVLFSRPNIFRIDVYAAEINQPAMTLVQIDEEVRVYLYSERSVYQGGKDDFKLEVLLGLPFKAFEGSYWLMGDLVKFLEAQKEAAEVECYYSGEDRVLRVKLSEEEYYLFSKVKLNILAPASYQLQRVMKFVKGESSPVIEGVYSWDESAVPAEIGLKVDEGSLEIDLSRIRSSVNPTGDSFDRALSFPSAKPYQIRGLNELGDRL